LGIVICLGLPGSGKTSSVIRDIVLNQNRRTTYANIIPMLPKETPNLKQLEPGMIIDKQLVKTITKKSGEIEPVYERKLNIEFWKSIKEPINLVIDEAHTIYDARRFMSANNRIMNDFVSLIRRILGQNSTGYGDLIFITQLPNRIDTVARDMATQVRFHRCHFIKECKRCGYKWGETSDTPNIKNLCDNCDSYNLELYGHRIEVWHFRNMKSYNAWEEMGIESFYSHYFIHDITDYFKYYDTMQWDNLISNY